MDAHEHEHAFADLAHDLLVDRHARALDALEDETHRPSACCCEEQQELRARQRTVVGRLDSVKRSRARCETLPANWLACAGAAFLAPAAVLERCTLLHWLQRARCATSVAVAVAGVLAAIEALHASVCSAKLARMVAFRHAKMAAPVRGQAWRPKTTRHTGHSTPLRSLEHALEAWPQ